MHKPVFINIEGIDGSGKGTQFGLLTQKLTESGIVFESYDFPDYGSGSAKPLTLHLTGQGPELEPMQIAELFAVDRLFKKDKLHTALAMGKLLLTNRYVGSNMAYQAARVETNEERKEVIDFIEQLEYGVNKLPRPTINIITAIDASISQKNVDSKGERDYVNGRDVNEANEQLQQNVAQIYDTFCAEREDFVRVECMGQDGSMLSKELIHEKIWNIVKQVL